MAITSEWKSHERRAFRRYKYNAHVTYSTEDAIEPHHAEITEYSMEGINLIGKTPVKEGTEIFIRMKEQSADSAKHYHTVVKWCRRLEGPDTVYKIGTHYQKKRQGRIFGFRSVNKNSPDR